MFYLKKKFKTHLTPFSYFTNVADIIHIQYLDYKKYILYKNYLKIIVNTTFAQYYFKTTIPETQSLQYYKKCFNIPIMYIMILIKLKQFWA